MKKGFTSINLQIPKATKAYFERQAKKLMVSTSALVRATLCDKAKEAQAEEAAK